MSSLHVARVTRQRAFAVAERDAPNPRDYPTHEAFRQASETWHEGRRAEWAAIEAMALAEQAKES